MRYNVFLKIALFEIMWKNIIESHKSQIWIRRMRFACWITKTTEGRSEYLILIAFLRQQWLRVIRTLSCLYELFVNRVMAFACNKCVCFVGVGRTWNEGSMTVWTTEKSSVIRTEHGMRGVWRCGQRRKAPSSLRSQSLVSWLLCICSASPFFPQCRNKPTDIAQCNCAQGHHLIPIILY